MFRTLQSKVDFFKLEIDKPESPFDQPKQAGQTVQFAGTATTFTDFADKQIAGAHIAFVLDIKESFQPFGPSGRIGALIERDSLLQRDSLLERDYLAMNQPVAARTEEEVR